MSNEKKDKKSEERRRGESLKNAVREEELRGCGKKRKKEGVGVVSTDVHRQTRSLSSCARCGSIALISTNIVLCDEVGFRREGVFAGNIFTSTCVRRGIVSKV